MLFGADMRRNPCCVNATTETYPRFPTVGEVLAYVQKPRFASVGFKGQTVILRYDFLTPRYDFKAFLLFAGKFQPFEFKTDFSVFSALILSSPVFKVTTR